MNEPTPKAEGTTGEAKSRRALLIATLVAALALLGIFAMSRAGESLVYYWSPTELRAAGKQPLGASIRLGGVVVPGSVQKSANGLDLRFRVSDGQGEVADSWVGKGENKAIAPGDLGQALGIDQINALTAQTGLSQEELLAGLSQQLPGVIDQLTPDGRLPTESELSKWI